MFELRPYDDLQTDHFEKATRRGRHVVRCVVGIAEALPKELLMKLGQRRPFELAASASWNGAIFRALVFGIDEGLLGQTFGRLSQTHQLGPGYVDVKANVVAHHVGRLCGVGHEFFHDLVQRQAFILRTGRGDSMNLGGVERNGEPVRLHDAVATGQKSALRVVQLPRQLDQSRPVVAVGDGCIPIPWQSRRLRVVD